jgi:hypothetical protein
LWEGIEGRRQLHFITLTPTLSHLGRGISLSHSQLSFINNAGSFFMIKTPSLWDFSDYSSLDGRV